MIPAAPDPKPDATGQRLIDMTPQTAAWLHNIFGGARRHDDITGTA